MPLISILMPAWNAEATIGEAVKSLLAQSFTDFELVLVDDGSTDRTVEVAGRDPRLRVVQMPRGGIVSALQAGLSASSGTFIARMDADDIAHPDRLARQLEFLRAHPDVRVCSCLVEVFPSEQLGEGMQRYEQWVNAHVTHDDIVRELFVESPLPHPSVMMYREDCSYEEHGWPEDYDLWLRCYERGLRFGKVPEVLLRWRHSEKRLSMDDPRYHTEKFVRAKAHYLARMLQKEKRRVTLWGAGKTGRRLLKGLLAEGIAIESIIDIDPRKIGRDRRGVRVVDASWLKDRRGVFVIAAVSQLGARDLIRRALNDFGFQEGADFLCAA